MNERVEIYHFTKKENIESIFRDGLTHGTKFHTLGSQIRKNASYFWLSPAHDAMGYKENDDYECLQIRVDESLCMVGSMDLISSAFVNFVLEKKGENLYDYRALVQLFDSTAVRYSAYKDGLFRTPEVAVQAQIPPEDIQIVKQTNASQVARKFINNRRAYNERIKNKLALLSNDSAADLNLMVERLEDSGAIKKVAVHDDSCGILYSYITENTGEFFTIEQKNPKI